MTIKQIAKELKVSPQAIYQRLQSRKIDVKTLTHPVTKELTSEGEFVIRAMYDQGNNQGTKQGFTEKQDNSKELEELRKQAAELIENNSILKKRVEELEEDKEYFKRALEKSQDNFSEIKNLLPGAGETGGGTERKLTWRERFTGKIKKA